jgi:predicted nucleic acid-binding protein
LAVLFFDTSALVRRYDETEPGADRVEALCSAAAGNVLLISRITSVEVASAFNGKLRLGTIDAMHRDELWRVFRFHRRQQYRNVPLDRATLAYADRLTFCHPLRAYDAVHLASALLAASVMRETAGELRFCTADRRQAAAAEAEGLDVELIG